MIKSMTGFGKAVAKPGKRTVTIEVRTLNSKQLDVNTRLPSVYRERESEIRAAINEVLERGKIDFSLSADTDSDAPEFSINGPLARKYYSEIKMLADELGENPGTEIISSILKLPDVFKPTREELDDDEWNLIKTAIGEALRQTDDFRKYEGELLGDDMLARIKLILALLNQVEPFEKARIGNLRERFRRNQDEFFDKAPKPDKFDENRFEQEIFWYLEKLDITEEKLRLRKHCDYFAATLKNNESVGRKLGFIAQEIGREVNTLGSKAYDAEIQMIVVQMKDELEKIKEQIGNIL